MLDLGSHIGKSFDAWPHGHTSHFPELGFVTVHQHFSVEFDRSRNGDKGLCAQCGNPVWEVGYGIAFFWPGTIFLGADCWCSACIGPEVL